MREIPRGDQSQNKEKDTEIIEFLFHVDSPNSGEDTGGEVLLTKRLDGKADSANGKEKLSYEEHEKHIDDDIKTDDDATKQNRAIK